MKKKKKILSQAHQKHTLRQRGGTLCPWTANSWEGLGVAWRLASRPLPSPVQMGEVRLRLAAAPPHPHLRPSPPLPKLPIPIKGRLKIAEEGKGGRKAKEHDCSVFYPQPSLRLQPNQIKQEASETEEECLLIFAWAPSPPVPSLLFIFYPPLLKILISSMPFGSYVIPNWMFENYWGKKVMFFFSVYHYLKLSRWEMAHQLDIRCKMAMTSQFIVIRGCHMK